MIFAFVCLLLRDCRDNDFASRSGEVGGEVPGQGGLRSLQHGIWNQCHDDPCSLRRGKSVLQFAKFAEKTYLFLFFFIIFYFLVCVFFLL